MSQIENHLRDALTDVADEIPADAVPPLNLPGDTVAVVRLADRRRSDHRRWLAPAAAAAAVLAIAAGVAVTASLPHPPVSNPVGQQRVPGYYIALATVPGRGPVAAIYATSTGQSIAVPRYRGQPLGGVAVAGSESGHRFVVAGQAPTGPDLRFYVVDFNPATKKSAVALLPEPHVADTNGLEALALSPDGTKLAIAYEVSELEGTSGYGKYRLVVADVRTGKTRTWTSGQGAFGVGTGWSVSWAEDDMTLAFNWYAGQQLNFNARLRPGSGIRMLNTAGPTGDLIADSELILPFGVSHKNAAILGAGLALPGWLTPDGTTVVLPVVQFEGHSAWFARYSAATGRLERIFGDGPYRVRRPTGAVYILWVSDDGRTLVVYGPPGHPGRDAIVRGNHLTLLPQPKIVRPAYTAW